jgi:uncharacterized membrane protein YgaE (UPF0421/DUF939 family)
MFLVRLIGCLLGIGLGYMVAWLFKLDTIVAFTLLSFILAIDLTVQRWISYVYMKSLLKNMPPEEKQ